MTKSPYRDNLPGYYQHAPETSREASVAIAPVASSIRAGVLAAILEAGPAGIISDDIADRLGLNVYQVRARVSELHAGKAIADSGRRGVGASGRRAAYWVHAHYAPKPDDPQGDLLAA